MIDDKKNGPAPREGYHAKSQRFASRIHYTVTPIDDIGAWKREQAAKQLIWNAERKERQWAARARAIVLLEDEAERKKALREQNKHNAGVEIDRLDAIKLVKGPTTEDGKFIYTPASAEVPQKKRGFLAVFRRLFA